MATSREKIEELKECPDAFRPIAMKLNEVIRQQNRSRAIAGIGMTITESDAGTKYDVSRLTATGTCNDDGTITIVIDGQI